MVCTAPNHSQTGPTSFTSPQALLFNASSDHATRPSGVAWLWLWSQLLDEHGRRLFSSCSASLHVANARLSRLRLSPGAHAYRASIQHATPTSICGWCSTDAAALDHATEWHLAQYDCVSEPPAGQLPTTYPASGPDSNPCIGRDRFGCDANQRKDFDLAEEAYG